jgi:hypothetical protein
MIENAWWMGGRESLAPVSAHPLKEVSSFVPLPHPDLPRNEDKGKVAGSSPLGFGIDIHIGK